MSISAEGCECEEWERYVCKFAPVPPVIRAQIQLICLNQQPSVFILGVLATSVDEVRIGPENALPSDSRGQGILLCYWWRRGRVGLTGEHNLPDLMIELSLKVLSELSVGAE